MVRRMIQMKKGLFKVIGLILLIGTAGASDMGSITIFQILIQVLLGLCLILAGCFCGRKEAEDRQKTGKVIQKIYLANAA